MVEQILNLFLTFDAVEENGSASATCRELSLLWKSTI